MSAPPVNDRSAALRAKMEARKKHREETGELGVGDGELELVAKEDKEKEAEAAAASAEPENYKLYQTLYEYKSDDPEDLNFGASEILKVIDDEDDWYEGINQDGKKGYFPGTYVRIMKMQPGGGGGGGSVSIGGMPP
eukprot:gene4569-19475_t